MAVQEQTPYIEHVANGVTTSFALGFVCDSADKLMVTVNDLPTNVGDWSFIEGEVIFQFPPLSESIIKIWRNSPLARSTTFKTYDNSLNPNSLNFDLDKIWLVMQELNVKNSFSDNKLQEILDSLVAGNVNGLPAEILARIAGDENTKILVNLEANRAYQAEIAINNRVDNEALIANQNVSIEKVRAEEAEQNLLVQINAVGVGNKAYKTYADMDADKANIPAKSKVTVTNDATTSNNGDWQWDGAVFTKSVYDPLNQSKNYVDSKIKAFSIYLKVDCYVESVLDANGFTRVKMQSKAGQSNFYDSRTSENSQNIKELNVSVKGVEIYKKIPGIAVVYIDENGYTRLKEKSVDGVFESYIDSKVKQLIPGTGISLLETAETIEISTGEIVYETPNEYVLCLVIGQSNNTTEGGNASEAPTLPNGVCLIWDNTYNTLGDINLSGQKASVVPAMALEFYKQTGMGLIVVNSAVGASAMSELAAGTLGRSWDVTGTLRQPAIDRLNACKAYLDSNNYCYQLGFISWSQGEQDGLKIADNTITVNDYRSAFTTFVDFIKTNVGQKAPFIITRTAYRTADNAGYKAVRDTQMELAHTISNVYMGYTGTTKFFSRNLMHDSVHYNQNGKNIVGTTIGKIASKLSAGVN